MTDTELTISIVLLTYMHEAFVKDALNGIFSQNVTARIEVIATEDCSQDGTFTILEEYRRRYPGMLSILRRDQRVGGKRNLLDAFARCKGDYTCILDGDDYWTDPSKLSDQLQILEANPQLVACAHNTCIRPAGGPDAGQKIVPEERVKDRYNIADLIEGKIYLHTSSLLFRNIFKGGLPAAQSHPRVGDYFMSMLFAEHGDIAFINRTMSVYRMTGSGAWSTLSPLVQRMRNVDGLVIYNYLLRHKYADMFDWRISREAKTLLRAIRKSSNAGIRYYLKYAFLRLAFRAQRNPRRRSRRPFLVRMAEKIWLSDFPADTRLH